YRSTATSGSFTATGSTADSESGIASYAFGSAGAGWTSTPGTLGVNTYSWASASPATTSPTVSATNNAALTSTGNPTITLTGDGTAPTSAAVSYTSGYVTTLSVPVTFSASDAAAGLNTAASYLQRATATLTSGSCGSYSGFSTLVTGASSVYSDTSVVAGNCYKYQYVATDNVGNAAAAATSASVTKVDTSAPAAPTLAYSALTNTYASGNTVYYKSNATTGSFTATATATDTVSGIASYAFGSAGAGWTSTPGSLGVNTYSWASGSPTTTSPTVSTTNGAGLTSTGNPTITLTADTTAPTSASVSYTNGSTSTLSVPVTFSASDAASGVDDTSGYLQRSSATLSGGSCGSYSGFSTLVTGATSPYSDTSVTAAHCYKYQYVAVDNVGNTAAAATSASVVQVVDYGIFTTIADVGAGSPSGTSSSYSSGTSVYTEVGNGTDINNASDQFHYLYKSWTGNGTIIARLTSFTNTSIYAKAGVMFRESSAAGSAYARMDVKPVGGDGSEWGYRSSTGGATTQAGTGAGSIQPTYWVKLVRSGNTFTGYNAPDVSGSPGTWTQRGTQTISMASTILVGLATCSHNTSSLATATYDHVTVS
ncbi:MAG: hypothetical protein QOD41_1472, partial [Cryptosporangiaceae bacterium]|nr:hypothetical protein [Cryptosporangiaceae bacterium]